MRDCQVLLSNCLCLLICGSSTFGSLGFLISILELSNVAVVITDHLDKESFGLSITRLGKHLVLNHIDDSLTVSLKLTLNS